jgi:hypothetical protein
MSVFRSAALLIMCSIALSAVGKSATQGKYVALGTEHV